jgi:Tol biopolymer transport system component/DNA-binding winged helix-turn-helix (wHTH) protein
MVDICQGELRKSGIRIRVQGQPMMVLLALLERPGELITREELQQRLWPDIGHLDFEHGLNVAVKKLRTALSDSAEAPRYIETIARKGYRFIATVEAEAAAEVAMPSPAAPAVVPASSISRPALYAGLAVAVVLVVLGAAAFRLAVPPAPAQVSTLVATDGSIGEIRLSRDGTQVIYTLAQEGEARRIYIKAPGLAPARRLSDDADPEHTENSPRWVPDGSGISLMRRSPGMPEALYVVPVTGGTPRKLIELPDQRGYAWMPDGKSMIAALPDPEGTVSLYSVAIGTGQRVRLTHPPNSHTTRMAADGDMGPEVSPDGGRVVFVRTTRVGLATMVMSIPGGEPVRVAPELSSPSGLAWTPDSREIVFSAFSDGAPARLLYRLRVPGGKPTPLSLMAPGSDPHGTSTSANDKLAYTVANPRMTIWRYPLPGAPAGSEPVLVADSPRMQMTPAFAPDGKHFAFISSRTGTLELFVADRTGKNPVQLTDFRRGDAGWSRWSPDGRKIAIDARPSSRSQILLVDPEGGTPQTLVNGPDDAMMPEWSADSQWVYYTRVDTSGHGSLWKIRLSDRAQERVSADAWCGFPSPDGKTLFTLKRGQFGLYSMPMEGGAMTLVAPGVFPNALSQARSGVYFIDRGSGPNGRRLMHYWYGSGRIEEVMTFPRPATSVALSVSADEAEVLFTRNDGTTSQILMADRFR